MAARRAPRITAKRAYDPPARGDGVRILADRLWPRGLRKADAHIDEWRKDLAPTTELRRFYDHRPERFREFSRRYRAELRQPDRADTIAEVLRIARRRPVTLLTATRDLEHSGAAVLATYLRRRVSESE
jgi:uncharacterized protein YeaO (DUF488 family)